MKHFAIMAGESDAKIFKHAEFSAIISAGKEKVHTVLVQRFNENGSMANAMPCPTCQAMLGAFGVKRVIYTHEHGFKEWYPNE